jgi:hypothetical protein
VGWKAEVTNGARLRRGDMGGGVLSSRRTYRCLSCTFSGSRKNGAGAAEIAMRDIATVAEI